MIKILDNKEPGESVVLEFDFGSDLAAIDTVTLAVSAVNGTDLAAQAVKDGIHQILGSKVLQRMSGGIDRSEYKFKCTATRGQDKRVLTSVVPVVAE